MVDGKAPRRCSRGLVVAVAACLAPLFAVQIKSYDVWWHLATGRWIVGHGRLPTTDPFTYTMAGKPWRLVNGLSDLALYGCFRIAGHAGVVGAKVACALLTLTLVGLTLRALLVSRPALVATMVLAAGLLQARYSLARPLILGASLVAAASFMTLRYDAHPRRRWLWFFVLALPLWPLVHGSAVVGMAQLGLLALTMARRERRRNLRPVATVLALALVLVATLPWWRDLLSVVLSLQQNATATQFTAEWRSGLETAPHHLGHLAVIALGVLGGAWCLPRGPLPFGLAVLGAVLAARFGRNAYEGVLLALPAFALGLERGALELRRRLRPSVVSLAVVAAPLAIGFAQLGLEPNLTINRPFGWRVDRDRYPYDTLETLRKLPVARLFNDFPTGGFLIWQGGPWGVYCDGRTVALYQERDVAELFLPMLESAESLTAAADRWAAPYGLNENLSHPNQWMMVSPEWVPLHLGTATTLFIRRTHVGTLPATVRPLPLLRYSTDVTWTAGFYRGILADPELRHELVEQLRVAAALSPRSSLLERIADAVTEQAPSLGAELRATVTAARGHERPR